MRWLSKLIDVDELKNNIVNNRQTPYEFLEDYLDDINKTPPACDLKQVIDKIKDNVIEFEMFGILSEYIPLHRVITIVKNSILNK